MKIIYHHRTRGRGAEGVHITGVCDALTTLGHDVSLLSFPGSEPDITKSDSPSLNKRVKKKSFFAKVAEMTKIMPQFVFEILELGYNGLAYKRLCDKNKEVGAEFVYERYSLFTFAGLLFAKSKKLPFIIEVNDSALVERVRPLKLSWLAKKIEKYVFQRADGIVFISTEFQKIATNSYGKIAPSIISPNAANIAHFKHDAMSNEDAKAKLGIDKNKIVAGYTGAFVHWHGIDWFIEEIISELKSHPDLTLLLIGDGVAFEPISELVKAHNLSEQVILTGRIAHTELSTYMSAMDFGILPDSNIYGSPMKLFEFMAMGKAMVLPSFTPITDVVENNKTGWIFEAKDRKACVKKVLEIYQNKEEIKQVGENARNYIVNERQWTHNAKDLLALAFDNKEVS